MNILKMSLNKTYGVNHVFFITIKHAATYVRHKVLKLISLSSSTLIEFLTMKQEVTTINLSFLLI